LGEGYGVKGEKVLEFGGGMCRVLETSEDIPKNAFSNQPLIFAN